METAWESRTPRRKEHRTGVQRRENDVTVWSIAWSLSDASGKGAPDSLWREEGNRVIAGHRKGANTRTVGLAGWLSL